jgi:hypothetical protein
MLVMEFMQYGSLYDLLHNASIAIDGELICPILQGKSLLVHFDIILYCRIYC